MMMTSTESAWVAGLLEAKGSFACGSSRSASLHSHVVGMNSGDRDVVERLAAVTGIGTVRPRGQQQGCRPLWIWRAYADADVADLLTQIRPFMGSRRGARIDAILEYRCAR